MKKSFRSTLVLLGLAVFLHACDGQGDSLINDRLEDNPLPEPFAASSGTADFSTYVSLGASFTAGYTDGALYDAGQRYSYPNMIATQLSIATDNGITFNQPSINSVNGFNTSVGQAADTPMPLGRFKLDTSIPGPSPVINGDPVTAYSGPQVHNFGVGGIQVIQLDNALTGGPAAGNPLFNPFYQRFASAPGTSTILDDALAIDPTFFSLWIGPNDVLGYAVSGASNEAILTDAATFQAAYTNVITKLMSASSQPDGVVLDIPFFLGLPYFQAVPYNAVPLTDQATVDAVNAGYAAYNGGLQVALGNGLIDQAEADRRTINFTIGANAFVMEDEDLTDLSGLGLPNYRQTEATDLIMLGAASVLPTGTGTQTPAGDALVLTPEEQATIETSRQTFNAIIAGIVTSGAAADRIAFVQTTPFANPADPTSCTGGIFCDIFGLTDGVPGITVEGVDLAPDFSPNGIFSTDAIHLNPKGQAIFANVWIDAIEAKFGASIPSVNVTNLPSVEVCAGDCASQQ